MKYFTYIENIEPEYQKIIDQNIWLLGDDFQVFRECPYKIDPGTDMRWKSDVARMMWLRDNPAWTWIDADAYLLKPIDYNIKKVQFYKQTYTLDIAVIVGNGDSKVFDNMLKSVTNRIGWAQNYINRNCDLFDEIPMGYFKHKALHRLWINKNQ